VAKFRKANARVTGYKVHNIAQHQRKVREQTKNAAKKTKIRCFAATAAILVYHATLNGSWQRYGEHHRLMELSSAWFKSYHRTDCHSIASQQAGYQLWSYWHHLAAKIEHLVLISMSAV
jgi:hypothetical protein